MFSAVIPVYNHAHYLPWAVLSALASPLVSEVLLVDDGSRDHSRDVIRALATSHARVRDLTIPEEGNRGAHVRLNQLVAAARCDWVAVLNSDDRFAPGRFEAIAQPARRREAELFFGDILIMDGGDQIIGRKRAYLDPEFPYPPGLAAAVSRGDWQTLLFSQNFMATTSNMVFTKDLHAKVGGFADRRYCHDWEFALRAVLSGAPCRHVAKPFTVYRVHASNTIGEGDAAILAETRAMFEAVLSDHPGVLDNAGQAAALGGSRYWTGA